MKSCPHILWLCLLSGCSLDSAPLPHTEQAQHASSAMWTPQSLAPARTAEERAEAGARAITAATPIQKPAQDAPGNAPDASMPTTAPDPTPTASSADASMPTKPANASVPPATQPDPPPATAGSPAPTMPPPAAPPARDAGPAAPDPPNGPNASERLIDAVIAALNEGPNRGKGEGKGKDGDKNDNKEELKEWRMAARGSPQLTAELATTALLALQRAGACAEQPGACDPACQAIGSDCTQCAAEARCAALLGAVCGGQPAGCPRAP